MPEWKPQVVEAFQTLNLDIDVATLEEAAKAYKIQAIRTHPDKNLDDPAATMRFQTLGAAWTTCQRHFEDPESSYVTSAPYDEEVDLDDLGFFMFMFEEAINERYFSSRKYRRSRGQGPRVVLTPFGSFGVFPSESSYTSSPSYHSGPSSYSGGGYSGGGYSRSRQLKADDYNERDQARDKAGYEKRLREFEKQIEREEEELRRQAKEKSKDEEKRAAAYQQAFHAARAGKAGLVLSLVQEYDLDVNFKIPKVTSKNKPPPFQTLLHAACRVCDEGLIIFLLDRGAIPDALNDAKMTPFHVAISCGNVAVVKFFLLRRVHGKQTPGCHPSKTAPSGLTPLQIAIASGNAEMVAIMTQQATVHDVERCWLQPDAAPLRSILLEKKGFVDPETKELRRQEEERKVAEERAREEQRVADEKERLAEKARLKDERQRRAAEQKAREEEKKREEAVLARQKQEAEERKAELERMAAEARRREEQEAAESRRRAEREAAEAEARRSAELGAAEARRKAEAAARRKAQQEAEAQRKADAERERRRVEQEAAETRRRAEEAEAERLTEARLRAEAEARKLAEEQERARRQEEENIRLQQVAAQEAERQRRAALEQQRVEKKRAETLRRLQAQAEEHRRLAEARAPVEPKPAAPQRPSKLETHNMAPQSTKPLTEDAAQTPVPTQTGKLPKKLQNRDLSQLSPLELTKRAAQSARDKARIAEQKRLKTLEASAQTRPDTPESLHRGRSEDYVPPTPVSMPSPTQRRLSPPLVPHHTRPNVPARKMDPLGVVQLGLEDIQTGAIADDLFAVERSVATVPATREREGGAPLAFRGRGRGGYRARGRGRGRGRGGLAVEH